MRKSILIIFSILFFALPLFSQDPEESAKLLDLINGREKKQDS